ncbi:hypothetical protein [Nocardioides sp. zg-DK7169]|uniref:hypothetical protein n=1 Tax=Nocardioides sp. zg-DK7169 TaxID=2736600 RepID=UPI0015575F7D|nr:hypothetical protein [Nocardioides sp. zg-DK7169]NPC96301.1 hypothetical protein [Nocardioides sp. zg-DK7169]
MNVWLFGITLALTALGVIATIVLLVKDETAGDPTFALLAVLEVVLLVQVVWGLSSMSGDSMDKATFVGYLIAVPLIVPLGAFWSLAERTRAGTAVLLVALVTVAALQLRVDSLWGVGA